MIKTLRFRHLLIVISLILTTIPLFSYTETGQASWYGGKFQGRTTASGEIFDTQTLTAAHKTLPFGTQVEVTNLTNKKMVIVRINDRGPFVDGRIIDLSRAAADAIDMVGMGVADVEIRIIEHPEQLQIEHRVVPTEGTVILQVGSYGVRNNAKNLQTILIKGGFFAELEPAAGNITRVVIPNVTEDELEGVLNRLSTMGYPHPLIRRTM